MTKRPLFILLILVVSMSAAKAYADDTQAVEPPNAQNCNDEHQETDNFIDLTHKILNETLCIPAAWFDGFFANDRIDEEIRPGSRVRWSNDFIQTKDGGFEYVTKVRASLYLPKAKNSLKLVFEGEQESSFEDVVPTTENDIKTNVAVLFEFLKTQRSNLSFKLRLSPKLSARYRYAYPFSDTFITRFTQSAYIADGDSGTQTRLDMEKRLNDDLLLRWTNTSAESELIDGSRRTTALVLFQKLSAKSALSYESSITARTVPETYNDNARIALRYRQNFYRKWLFYELVPEVTWPREFISDERKQVVAFTFRLEVNFINM